MNEAILGNLDPYAKPISPPCKGGRGDFETVSYGTANRITYVILSPERSEGTEESLRKTGPYGDSSLRSE